MDAFTTPVTNSTNKYGEAFVMPKQTVQIIIPTVVLIVGQNIVAQRDMKGILAGGNLEREARLLMMVCRVPLPDTWGRVLS